SIGVVVGVATVLFFVTLGFGLESLLRTKVFAKLPPNEVEVIPEVFATGQRAMAVLNDADVEKISKIPKVVAAHPRLECTFPAPAYLEDREAVRLLGRRVPQMDLFVDGVRSDLVRSDAAFFGNREKFVFHGDDPGKPIPVVLANSLYHMYTTAVAPSLKLPVF